MIDVHYLAAAMGLRFPHQRMAAPQIRNAIAVKEPGQQVTD
jgi:hypothetical protein